MGMLGDFVGAFKEGLNDDGNVQNATVFCSQCGAPIAANASFCSSCGAPQAQSAQMVQQQPQMMQQQPQQMYYQAQPQQASALRCPNCGSPNVSVQLVEQGQITTKKGVGFGGHMNNLARGTTAVMTLGVSNLVWKKSEGTNKTKTVNSTMGICQNCGNAFEINKGKFGSAPGSIFR